MNSRDQGIQHSLRAVRERLRLAVVGSRGFHDYELVERVLGLWPSTEIITGGATGADALAERWGRAHGCPVTVFPADWRRQGRAAGYLRNRQVIANADVLLAFWDGTSPGTRHAIALARRASVPRVILHVGIRSTEQGSLGVGHEAS